MSIEHSDECYHWAPSIKDQLEKGHDCLMWTDREGYLVSLKMMSDRYLTNVYNFTCKPPNRYGDWREPIETEMQSRGLRIQLRSKWRRLWSRVTSVVRD